jgi:tRNA-dihydrouridine synthase B
MEQFFDNSLTFGNLTVKNRVFLAPLAGVSDVPFRRICQELGAGFTYVEMLSATAIKYKNKRTFEMMARHSSETVLGVQVTGSSAEDVASAVEVLDAQGFNAIDINMGCPVRKVVNAGCGSAILKDQERVIQTVRLSRQATSRPLSAKFRLGYTRDDINVEKTTENVLLAGVDMLTIHGRTRSEDYATPVDRQGIAKGIQVCNGFPNNKTIRLGNGDIFDTASAKLMVKETGCDAIMVSRGALGNPWIFKEILLEKTYEPTTEEWLDVILRHISYHREFYGNSKMAAILIRKHLLWYTKGFPGCKAIRDKLNLLDDLDTGALLLKNFAEQLPSQLTRNSLRAEEKKPTDATYDPKYEMDRVHDRGVGDEEMTAGT